MAYSKNCTYKPWALDLNNYIKDTMFKKVKSEFIKINKILIIVILIACIFPYMNQKDKFHFAETCLFCCDIVVSHAHSGSSSNVMT